MKKKKKTEAAVRQAAIYLRKSRQDGREGESNSIGSQRSLTSAAARKDGYSQWLEFKDDGVSGTTTNRPGLQKLLAAVEADEISVIYLKDLSRLSRNTLDTGLMQLLFDEHNVRVVALTDGVDLTCSEDEMLIGFHNLINEGYARDISKKVRASKKVKAESGAPLGPPPYGYVKNPGGPVLTPEGKKDFWLPDPEAALNVQKIFQMFLDGCSIAQISAQLEREKVLPPRKYALLNGRNCPGRYSERDGCRWPYDTVRKILKNRVYTGAVVNMKARNKSFKCKKRIKLPPEEWLVFPGVNEPIIDEETFSITQDALRERVSARPLSGEARSPFSGMLYCSDCGSLLSFHKNQVSKIESFCCSEGNRANPTCTRHYIRCDHLNELVASRIRKMAQAALADNEAFKDAVLREANRERSARLENLQAVITKLEGRLTEINEHIALAFEKSVSGSLSEETSFMLIQKYEQEKADTITRIESSTRQLRELEEKQANVDFFTKAISKYTQLKKVTKRILNELVDHIEVHERQKTEKGKWTQQVDIYFRCVGLCRDSQAAPSVSKTFKPRVGVMQTIEAS